MGEGAASRDGSRQRVKIPVGRGQHKGGVVDEASKADRSPGGGSITKLKRPRHNRRDTSVIVTSRQDGRAPSELIDLIERVHTAHNGICNRQLIGLVEIDRPSTAPERDPPHIQSDVGVAGPDCPDIKSPCGSRLRPNDYVVGLDRGGRTHIQGSGTCKPDHGRRPGIVNGGTLDNRNLIVA